ncbi:MAG TPA: penicillin-binding protein 1C [Thermoanaerobaculia bacterium]|nr:penicillin-binding protein 1C [Thermoanaerobaculia bacterium]
MGCSVIAGWIYLGSVPDITHSDTPTVVDRNGVVLFEPLSLRGDRTESMQPNALPPLVVQATIAAEDKRFFSHHGVDGRAVLRAAWHDVKRLRLAEGGSTISQQVAKLLLGRKDRGVIDKAHEAIVAIRLERRHSKNELLALYLNLAPYGNQTTGVARASRLYFGCTPEDLTAAQSAFLASLPQRPGAFNPLRDEKRALSRQRFVLAKMHTLGYITERELASARAERLRFERGERRVVAQHFVERVLERAPRRRRIETTLDASLQREVAGIIAAQKRDLLDHGAHSVAVAVLDNHTGEWLAWEGSGDYFGTDFGGGIDGVTALRQPGSALKPFTYALAFERGDSPATVLADVPSHFATAEKGVVYTPRNYDGRYRGPLRVRSALAGSENVPAVAMAAKLGPASLLRFLRRAGFNDFKKNADYYGVGLTLGDAEVRLEQLVAAYSIFARGGVYLEPTMLRRQPATGNRQRVVSEQTAFWITDILSDPDAREFVFGSGGNLDFPFTVAVKTGTSQAYRDNWTVGYTKDVTVGVWVGNFDRSSLRNSTGVTGAGPIFHAVMLTAAKRARGRLPVGDDTPILEVPKGLVRQPICALSGLRPSTSCPNVTSEWVASDAPRPFCSWHHARYIDWPPEYRAWSAAAMPAPSSPKIVHANLQILSPPNGATYLIDPTLRMPYQTLKLRASSTRVTWHIDQQQVASPDWPLQPGWHTVTAIDEQGRRDSVQIVVK